jgi:hypothetical protein
MKYEKAKAKADALLKAGDALGVEFPAESRRLLRLCREWRQKQSNLVPSEPGEDKE